MAVTLKKFRKLPNLTSILLNRDRPCRVSVRSLLVQYRQLPKIGTIPLNFFNVQRVFRVAPRFPIFPPAVPLFYRGCLCFNMSSLSPPNEVV
jgi:hypothetical protein